MKIITTCTDGVILAELTTVEANLIKTALTKPIKRKILRMSSELQELENQVRELKEFNDKFIKAFYPDQVKKTPKKTIRSKK